MLLRVGDLWWRGQLTHEVIASWQGGLFLFELLVSAVIPAVLLSIRRVRHSIAGLATCSTMTVLGIIGYRFDTCIIAFTAAGHACPISRPGPRWRSARASSPAAALVFIFFNENLRIMPHAGHDGEDLEVRHVADSPAEPDGERPFLFTADRRRYSLGFVIAGALAIGLLPGERRSSARSRSPCRPRAAATSRPWRSRWIRRMRREFHIASLAGNVPASLKPEPVTVRLIDGNRNWRFVPFTHDDHIKRLGDRESCRLCHHQNMTFDQTSAVLPVPPRHVRDDRHVQARPAHRQARAATPRARSVTARARAQEPRDVAGLLSSATATWW